MVKDEEEDEEEDPDYKLELDPWVPLVHEVFHLEIGQSWTILKLKAEIVKRMGDKLGRPIYPRNLELATYKSGEIM